jgi:DNA phosphorothioation-dependent restriction protein DptG
MLNRLKDVTNEQIGDKNLSPSTYYPFSNKDYVDQRTFDLREVVGLLISYISEKKIAKDYTYNDFKQKCLDSFKENLTDPKAVSILKEVFFTEDTPPLFSLLMFQAYKPELKSAKVFDVFKLLMKKDDYQINLDAKLNFLESHIVKQFQQELKDDKHNDQSISYLPFLDELFTKDVDFLVKKSHYFTQQAEKFIEIYLLLYTSQLALNLHPYTFEEPKSRPLYFILNYEKASIERKKLVFEGYKNLYDHAKYIFPYLSFLETMMKITDNADLRLYNIPDQLNDDEETRKTIEEFEKKFRTTRKLDSKFSMYNSVNSALEGLLASIYEQFQDQSSRKDIFEKYNRAFERQSAKPFLQGRGRFGKVLVLDQDTILLLTNIAIADQSQLRFQDLIQEFNNRGVHFDQQSQNALIELYERVGNIDRKSDSGDAIYVKSTL